jgi:hypothetical protein
MRIVPSSSSRQRDWSACSFKTDVRVNKSTATPGRPGAQRSDVAGGPGPRGILRRAQQGCAPGERWNSGPAAGHPGRPYRSVGIAISVNGGGSGSARRDLRLHGNIMSVSFPSFVAVRRSNRPHSDVALPAQIPAIVLQILTRRIDQPAIGHSFQVERRACKRVRRRVRIETQFV